MSLSDIPTPRPCRIIREGSTKFCPFCGSSLVINLLGKSRGCLQPECHNYHDLPGRAVEALSNIEQIKQIRADYDVGLIEAKRIFDRRKMLSELADELEEVQDDAVKRILARLIEYVVKK